MAGTAQMQALNEVQHIYGKGSFTEDHVAFRMVGYKRGEKTISAIGRTWAEAIEALKEKGR